MNTAIREAFIKASATAFNVLVNDAINSKAGVNKPNRGWTLNASPKTIKQLMNQGILA
jgi:hypothetical protein